MPSVDDEQRKKTLIGIKNYATAAKDIVDVGIHVIGRLHPAGAVILGFAYTLKNIIGAYGPDENQDIIDALGELRKKIDWILDRMTGHFTAFRAFYSENQFWNDIPLRTSVLYQYMLDVQTMPCEDSLRNFRHQYEKHSPVELAQRLNYQLTRDVMNPLNNAANTDEPLTDETFQKWQDLIGRVFKQLWEIEIKASVWVHGISDKKIEELDRVIDIFEQVDEFRHQMEIWEEHYEKNAIYWPEKVRLLAEDCLDKKKDEPYQEQANSIAELLGKIHTRSEFYVILFPAALKYQCTEIRANQTLTMKRNGLTVIIYRSLTSRNQTDAVLNEAFTNLMFYKEMYGFFPYEMSGRAYVVENAPLRETFKECGLHLQVGAPSNLVVAWTKSSLHKNGCGSFVFFTKVLSLPVFDKQLDFKFDYFVFVGYQ